MAKIPSNYIQTGLDVSTRASPWRETYTTGSYARMTVRAKAMKALAEGTNRQLARMPRVNFAQAVPLEYADNTGGDPLIEWRYDDSVINGREQNWHIIAVPRTTGSGSQYAARVGGASGELSHLLSATYASTVMWTHAAAMPMLISRGDQDDAERTEKLSTFNGCTVMSMVAQDTELDYLDTANHQYVDTGQAGKGEKVLADLGESMRSQIHSNRTTNLPILFNWAAQTNAGTYADVSATHQQGIPVSSATRVNLIDQSHTYRYGGSPGFSAHVQHHGWGDQGTTNGKLVRVQCRVLAKTVGGAASSTIYMEGPPVVSNNFTTIEITNGAGVAWYGDDSHHVYLDSAQADTITTSSRNKIDAFGYIDGRTVEQQYVYGLAGWVSGPPYA